MQPADPAPGSFSPSPELLPPNQGSAPFHHGQADNDGTSQIGESKTPISQSERFFSNLVSWIAILACSGLLFSLVFAEQFVLAPDPEAKPSLAQAETMSRMAVGQDQVLGTGGVATLEELRKGPIAGRLIRILTAVEVDGPELAAKWFAELEENIQQAAYTPTSDERELMQSVQRIIQHEQSKVDPQQEAPEPAITAEDSGNLDAGNPDAGNPDAGNPDAGNLDAGQTSEDLGSSQSEVNEDPSGTTDTDLDDAASGAAETVEVAKQAVDPEQLQRDLDLVAKELGFAGRLAKTWQAPQSRERQELLGKVKSGMIGFFVVASFVILTLLLSLALLPLSIYLVIGGRINDWMAAPTHYSHIYLETFALWFVLFVGAQIAVPLGLITAGFDIKNDATLSVLVNLSIFYLPLVSLAWLFVRHPEPSFAFKNAGFTSHGLFADMGAGLFTYVACLPLLAVAMASTAFLTDWVWGGFNESNPFAPPGGPSHPIQDQFGGGWTQTLMLYFMAAVTAPIVEEIVFRGLFFRYLRDVTSGWKTMGSVLLSALINSFFFAAIHPQGLLGIPPLLMLGVCMSLARQWREGLIAPMTIHAVHNGSLVTIMTLLSG